jgi:hypothetical protein
MASRIRQTRTCAIFAHPAVAPAGNRRVCGDTGAYQPYPATIGVVPGTLCARYRVLRSAIAALSGPHADGSEPMARGARA